MWYIYTKEQYSAVKKWHSEICRQMDGIRKKTHHKQDSTDPKGQTLYTLTFKRIKINNKG